jgi:hypothetical protein
MGLFRRNKNNNKPVIRQILDLVPRWLFESCTNLINYYKKQIEKCEAQIVALIESTSWLKKKVESIEYYKRDWCFDNSNNRWRDTRFFNDRE